MWIFDTTRDKKLYNIVLFLVRATAASFMLTHGLKKFDLLLEGGPIEFIDPFGIGESTTLILVIFAEVVCSGLLFIGLATRLVVVPLIVAMFTAVFVVHCADGFEKQELAGLYLLIYVFLLVAGSGKYSVDHMISRKKRKMFY